MEGTGDRREWGMSKGDGDGDQREWVVQRRQGWGWRWDEDDGREGRICPPHWTWKIFPYLNNNGRPALNP